MSKPFYKNTKTGNYGVLEGSDMFGSQKLHNKYLILKTVVARDGMIELGVTTEQVLPKDLIEVSPEEVQQSLL